MAGEGKFFVRGENLTGIVAGQVLLPADVRRIGVYFSSGNNIVDGGISVILEDGEQIVFTLNLTVTLEFLYKDWGPLPSCQWVAPANNPIPDLAIIELIELVREV